MIQRDQNDKGTCSVVVSPRQQSAARLEYTIDDGRRVVRSGVVQPQALADKNRAVLLEAIPVGGPYTVTVSPQGPGDGPKVSFRNVLVGDIWVLGGQSNMFGIDVIKETLPALPYLNMLDVQHILREGRWSAGLPPIHRIPDQFAPFTLKSQHPELSDDQVKKIIADKTPVGGIDCSYFFAPGFMPKAAFRLA